MFRDGDKIGATSLYSSINPFKWCLLWLELLSETTGPGNFFRKPWHMTKHPALRRRVASLRAVVQTSASIVLPCPMVYQNSGCILWKGQVFSTLVHRRLLSAGRPLLRLSQTSNSPLFYTESFVTVTSLVDRQVPRVCATVILCTGMTLLSGKVGS